MPYKKEHTFEKNIYNWYSIGYNNFNRRNDIEYKRNRVDMVQRDC